MPLPASPRSSLPLLLALVLVAASARAGEIQLVSADDRGVTLRLDVTAFDLRPGPRRGPRLVGFPSHRFGYDGAPGRRGPRRASGVGCSCGGGGAGAEAPAGGDRHWEPVLKRALLNYEQGRRWRTPAPSPGRLE